jgi:capsular polysaccharide biosynthesis protein
MTEAYEDAASRLWWGVRRFIWIFIAIVPITAGVALIAAHGAPSVNKQYKASALVIATNRNFSPELFARLADAVFTGGTVAEKAVEAGHLPIAPRDLIPTYASLEPVQDNIITRVVGTDTDPQVAAAIANAAASALVDELNKSGEGVGRFAVQDQARVPATPNSASARSGPVAVGIVAGVILGAGIIGLILALRRPVLGAGEAAELAGAPVLGTPTMPPLRGGRSVEPQQVKGLSALAKRLLPELPGVTALVSCGGDERIRTLIAQLVATVLAERDPTFLIRSNDEPVRLMYEQLATPHNLIVSDRMPDGHMWRRSAVVIDGPSARTFDIPQSLPARASVVLIVVEGAPLSRVREAAAQFLPGELDGIVFVRLSSQWPWLRSPAASVAAPPVSQRLDEWTQSAQTATPTQQTPAQPPQTQVATPDPRRSEPVDHVPSRRILLDQPAEDLGSERAISGGEILRD